VSPTALVVGGSGPTGQHVVCGLVSRGFDVSIFHTGAHEAEHPPSVSHIHGDPHFRESISESLRGLDFDVVVAQYGRLRYLVDQLGGHTGHLVAIGSATRIVSHADSPLWDGLGRPSMIPEEWISPSSGKLEGSQDHKLGQRVAETYRHLFEASDRIGFDATYLGYPILYGPRQPGCREWSVVRRVLDGRSSFLLADGGMQLLSRGYTENVAQAPLLAIDRPEVAAGRTFIVTDEHSYTQRQRVEFISHYLQHELRIVDLPYEVATPSHPLLQNTQDHRLITSARIRSDLGYVDVVDQATALERTVEWLVGLSGEALAELERQLGDPFDYAKEDELERVWTAALADLQAVGHEVPEYAHPYRHPHVPNEDWVRPTERILGRPDAR
jgi:nucleoside-diphosphate-sugar epimerase